MGGSGNGPDVTTYLVVVNHEGFYSIWPQHRSVPNGWMATGFLGPKESCLEHIEREWVDMAPLSIQRARSGSGSGRAE